MEEVAAGAHFAAAVGAAPEACAAAADAVNDRRDGELNSGHERWPPPTRMRSPMSVLQRECASEPGTDCEV